MYIKLSFRVITIFARSTLSLVVVVSLSGKPGIVYKLPNKLKANRPINIKKNEHAEVQTYDYYLECDTLSSEIINKAINRLEALYKKKIPLLDQLDILKMFLMEDLVAVEGDDVLEDQVKQLDCLADEEKSKIQEYLNTKPPIVCFGKEIINDAHSDVNTMYDEIMNNNEIIDDLNKIISKLVLLENKPNNIENTLDKQSFMLLRNQKQIPKPEIKTDIVVKNTV